MLLIYRKEDDTLKKDENIILVFPSQTNPYALADHIPALTSKDKRKLMDFDDSDNDSSEEISSHSSEHTPIAKGAEIEMTEIHHTPSNNHSDYPNLSQSTTTLADPTPSPVPNLPIQPPASTTTCKESGIDQQDPVDSPMNMPEDSQDNENKQRGNAKSV